MKTRHRRRPTQENGWRQRSSYCCWQCVPRFLTAYNENDTAMEAVAKDGQTLLDVAVQEYGTWEAALDVAAANGLSLTQVPAAGTPLQLPDGAKANRVTAEYCRTNGVSPATAYDSDGTRLRIFGEEFTREFT